MGVVRRFFGFFRLGAKRRVRQAEAIARANEAAARRAESEAKYGKVREEIEGTLFKKDEPKITSPKLLRPFWLLDEIAMCDARIESAKVGFRRFRAKTTALNVGGGVTTSQLRRVTKSQLRKLRKSKKDYGGATKREEAEREIAARNGPARLIRGMGVNLRRYTGKEVKAAKADRAGYLAELGQEAQKLGLTTEQLFGLYEVYRAQRGLETGPTPEGRQKLKKAA